MNGMTKKTTLVMINIIVAALIVGQSGCGDKPQEKNVQEEAVARVVKAGDTVTIHYVGKLENDTVVSGTRKDEPLTFVVGKGKVIPGLERGVIGMAVNTQRTVTVPPALAYGARRENLTRTFKRSELPPEGEYKKGMVLKLTDAQERAIPAVVTAVDEENITVDLNHPLAGRAVVYTIQLVSIQ